MLASWRRRPPPPHTPHHHTTPPQKTQPTPPPLQRGRAISSRVGGDRQDQDRAADVIFGRRGKRPGATRFDLALRKDWAVYQSYSKTWIDRLTV